MKQASLKFPLAPVIGLAVSLMVAVHPLNAGADALPEPTTAGGRLPVANAAKTDANINALHGMIHAVEGSVAPTPWEHMTAAAAAGYCIANHPYQTIHTGGYTPDGFEIVPPPGIVGAVRRNYIYNRSTTEKDEGAANSCPQACAQFGKSYEPSYSGFALSQKVGDGKTTISSGIGDLASSAIVDRDFYLDKDVVVGMQSRGNTWHESDVAQADFCCCGVH